LQTKHADKQMINIDTIPEISFNSKDLNLPLQLQQQQFDGSFADFWSTKLMQQPQTSGNLNLNMIQKRNEFSESEISFTDSNNDELPDDDFDLDNFNDDSNLNHDDQMGATQTEKEKSKRHRTHVNRMQKSILRKLFEDVKNPSMIDCENIGKEIGLFKRVVQVRMNENSF
jgi:hypothetical protein